MKAANGGDADAEAQVAALKAEVEAANAAADAASEKFDAAEAECDALFATLPNLLDDRVPDGDDDAANLVVDEWRTDARMLGDEGAYMWHDEIAALDGWDPDGASAVAGARFAVLRGPVARLERALAQLFLDLHTCVPGMRRATSLRRALGADDRVRERAARHRPLPKFADDLFAVSHLVNGEKAYMIPTAEVPLTNLRRGQMLPASPLLGRSPFDEAEVRRAHAVLPRRGGQLRARHGAGSCASTSSTRSSSCACASPRPPTRTTRR